MQWLLLLSQINSMKKKGTFIHEKKNHKSQEWQKMRTTTGYHANCASSWLMHDTDNKMKLHGIVLNRVAWRRVFNGVWNPSKWIRPFHISPYLSPSSSDISASRELKSCGIWLSMAKSFVICALLASPSKKKHEKFYDQKFIAYKLH